MFSSFTRTGSKFHRSANVPGRTLCGRVADRAALTCGRPEEICKNCLRAGGALVCDIVPRDEDVRDPRHAIREEHAAQVRQWQETLDMLYDEQDSNKNIDDHARYLKAYTATAARIEVARLRLRGLGVGA